jgi:hypothetical protein
MVPGWVALVEVKGYAKGAQTGALTQFLRFDRRYYQRTGRQPDALWISPTSSRRETRQLARSFFKATNKTSPTSPLSAAWS